MPEKHDDEQQRPKAPEPMATGGVLTDRSDVKRGGGEDGVRMTLLGDEFMSEYGGALKAGTVVVVDPATANRWRQKRVAVDSAETDKTLREQKLAEIERLRAEVEAIPPSGNFGDSVGRGGEAPTGREVQRAGRRA